LTLLYASLFLVAGSALLALTYGLLASSLPRAPSGTKTYQSEQILKLCKEQRKTKTTHQPVSQQCKQAFAAGTRAGSQSQRDQTLSNLLLVSLIGLGVMTVVSGGLGWIVSGRVLRPVRTITETARRASTQHLGERLALTGPEDELKELADTFDDMLERLDAAFESQSRFVANASHELRTPLTMMRTSIDVTLAKSPPTTDQLKAMAMKVRRSIDRAEEMIEALLTLATSDQGMTRQEPVELATVAEDALDAASPAIAGRGLQADLDLYPAQVVGDPFLLDRMVSNLIDNAVRHNCPRGWLRVRTGVEDGNAFLMVANSGPVVPEQAIPSLFDPFERVEPRSGQQQGVGLGLSIVRSIGLAHGASVVARSRPEGGLEVLVVLPGGLDRVGG